MLRILPIIFLFITQFVIATHVHYDCEDGSSKSQCTICQTAIQTQSLQAKDTKVLNEPVKEFVFTITFFNNIFSYQNIQISSIKNKAPPRI